MCSINWTKSRGHILFHKILSKRSPWALKDEEPCLFYCTDTPNSLGGMRLLALKTYAINITRIDKEMTEVLALEVRRVFYSSVSCIRDQRVSTEN